MNDTTKWPETVRTATQDDEAELFDLLTALYQDNGFGVPPRAQDLRSAIRAGTREQNGTLIGVIDGPDGVLAGSVCIFPDVSWWNREAWHLTERWLFVRPNMRAGAKLYDDLFRYMKAYQELSETSTGLRWPLATSVSSLKRLPAKMRLWQRYGKLVGGIYLIETGAQPDTGAASVAA